MARLHQLHIWHTDTGYVVEAEIGLWFFNEHPTVDGTESLMLSPINVTCRLNTGMMFPPLDHIFLTTLLTLSFTVSTLSSPSLSTTLTAMVCTPALKVEGGVAAILGH